MNYYLNEFFGKLYSSSASKEKGYDVRMASEVDMVNALKIYFLREHIPKTKEEDDKIQELCERALEKCRRRVTPWPTTRRECYVDYLFHRPIKMDFSYYPFLHTQEYRRYYS